MQQPIANQKRVIIVGATSGIGLTLAEHYLAAGHLVGLTGRNESVLRRMQDKYLGTAYIEPMDVTKPILAAAQLDNMILAMQGADIIIVNAGVGFIDKSLGWEKQQLTIETNVLGFSSICSAAAKYFIQKKSGHLVGISSIASLAGSDATPSYAASKAYVSNYLAGLRKKFIKMKLSIQVTDILPGFVDTPMGQSKQRFWVVSTDKAANQIIRAIEKNKKLAYISKRWRLIAWLMKILPDWIYNRI
ncbi:MAG: SDR family NAD(P)-dependent oxidoreductase [Enterobacterales bacterium]|nr:SDR family NAD(P)-dependent oxidoreductase [Enterobacterales bacterium]